jgi:REP element-mobilizing transposase RayT
VVFAIIKSFMARPLRIEYANAWYHILNRGRRSERIFADRFDYIGFTDLLIDTSEQWNLRVGAYCLMPNHYHLLVQTPDANISRCMRHIDGVYTQRFNRRHECDGSLFRGRYKSILIEADSYLLTLIRYIHRNPLKAGLTEKLQHYPWSSHRGYLSRAEKWNWLHKDFVLSMLSNNKAEQVRNFRQFISAEDDEVDEISKVLERKKWPSILGTASFIDKVKILFFSEKTNDEIPQSGELAPTPAQIKTAVCRHYRINKDELMVSKRGVFNESRNVAIYLTRRLRGDSLKEIGEQFRINKYSSVSSVIERLKTRIAEDRKLRKRIESIVLTLSKSQEQT